MVIDKIEANVELRSNKNSKIFRKGDISIVLQFVRRKYKAIFICIVIKNIQKSVKMCKINSKGPKVDP